MRFFISENETNMSDLAARLFGSGTGDSYASALGKANPQLAGLATVPAGSLIAIPSNAPELAPGGHAIELDAARSLTVQTVFNAVNALRQKLAEMEASAADRLRAAASVAAKPDLKTAQATGPLAEVAKHFSSSSDITKDTANLLQNLLSAQEARNASLTEFNSALVSFASK